MGRGYTHVYLLAPTNRYHFRGALVYPSEFLKFVIQITIMICH